MRKSGRVLKPTRRSLEGKESGHVFHSLNAEAEAAKKAIQNSEATRKKVNRNKRKREDSTERKKEVAAFANSRKQFYSAEELHALSAENAPFPGALPPAHIGEIVKRAGAVSC